MNEWQDYARRIAALPPDHQAAELAKLTPEQRRAFEEARIVASIPSPPPIPAPTKRRTWLWVLGCGCLFPIAVLAALFIFGVIGAGGIDELEKRGRESRLEREQQDAQERQDPQEQTPASAAVSAVELVSRYDANEIAADQIFKGRTLLIEGVVDDIGKDIIDSMYVTLKGPESSFRSVQCYFPEEDVHILAGLSPGQLIKLRGDCEGLFMNVQIKDCEVVE